MVTPDTAVSDQPAGAVLFRRFLRLLPGVALLFVLGFAGKLIEQGINAFGKAQHLALPNIEYVLWAIVLGLIIANTVGVPAIFQPGVATYEFWLKLGIVLLGARFVLADVLKLGGVSLALALVEIAVGLTIATVLGRIFRLKPKLTSLLAIGASICGVSAIIAGKGAIDADDDDAGFAIAAVLALGAISLFTFPAIGHLLDLSAHEFGLWAGLAVDNTAEATATGGLYSEQAQNVAVIAKSARNATIGFVVLGYAIYWATRGQAQAIGHKSAFLWEKFPKFVLGFLAVSALASIHIGDFHVFSKDQLTSIGNLSRWAFLLTFAGVGLRINIRELGKQGWRPFAVGLLVEISVAVITLGLVLAAGATIGLG